MATRVSKAYRIEVEDTDSDLLKHNNAALSVLLTLAGLGCDPELNENDCQRFIRGLVCGYEKFPIMFEVLLGKTPQKHGHSSLMFDTAPITWLENLRVSITRISSSQDYYPVKIGVSATPDKSGGWLYLFYSDDVDADGWKCVCFPQSDRDNEMRKFVCELTQSEFDRLRVVDLKVPVDLFDAVILHNVIREDDVDADTVNFDSPVRQFDQATGLANIGLEFMDSAWAEVVIPPNMLPYFAYGALDANAMVLCVDNTVLKEKGALGLQEHARSITSEVASQKLLDGASPGLKALLATYPVGTTAGLGLIDDAMWTPAFNAFFEGSDNMRIATDGNSVGMLMLAMDGGEDRLFMPATLTLSGIRWGYIFVSDKMCKEKYAIHECGVNNVYDDGSGRIVLQCAHHKKGFVHLDNTKKMQPASATEPADMTRVSDDSYTALELILKCL